MAKKSNFDNKKNSGEKTNAWSTMYDKLLAYAKVIEGSDWKMGWASTQRTWNGFPQNISGRQYTGGNSFYLMMATMANNHTVPIYATFNQIQKMNQHLMDEKGRIPKEKWAEAVHVRKGEQSEIVVFNTPLYVNPDNPKEKPLTTKDYEQLSKEEKEKYNQIWAHVPHVIFNIDQTNMKEVRPELYEKLVERMMPKQKQTFRQDTMGMYEEPAINYILKNQTWRCPIVFDKESKDAFYRPSTDTITVPMKEQYNIPYTEKELDNDINKFITPALSMKAVITDFSDADRQMQRVTEKKDNKEYLAELRATIMLENTFGKQLGMLRQDGQSINDYAKQISSAITNDRERVITIKDAEAKIIGGQDYYTTFLHEGAHSMHKELNIELNATGDKRGYAREEMRVESSTAMIAAAMGYRSEMFINSAAYVRGWNETANIQEKTKTMQQLMSDINKTVTRMGEIIDDARIKVGEEPVFKRSNSTEQKVEQQPGKQTGESVAVPSTHTPEQSSQKDTEVAATPMTYTLLLEQMMKQAKVHSLGLPDEVKIDYDNDMLTVDKYKEGVKHAEFASLPKNEQDSLGWSATEILLETLQNTLKRYAEKTTTDLTVNLPNSDTVSLNKGNLDETYNHLSKLEKIGVLNAFASAAEADAELLFDNALKNTKDNKIFLEPNNWIQKDDDGNLSIVLVKDNETKKSSLNDLNGLTQWSIVSFAVEENAQKIKQAKDAQAVTYPEQQTSPSDKVAETPAADQQASVAKSPDQQISPQTTVEPSQNEQTVVPSVAVTQQQNEQSAQHSQAESLQQQIADFKEATGIQLEVRDNKPYYDEFLDLRELKITKLPENLTVGGLLDLGDTPIKKLPEGLSVGGSLWLENTNIEQLPENLSVKGDLDLRNTPIKELPDNLTVKGDLNLAETNIKELPENLTVNGYLDLGDTPITKLPDNLSVGGGLYLADTNIKELPDNLTVNGDLDISDTNIEKLPENLTVNGNLDLSYTPIKELPDNLTVNGNLSLRNTKVEQLPDNLTVNGYLDLDYTPIKELPDNLIVGGDLYIMNTNVKALPDDIIVNDNLYVKDTSVYIPETAEINGKISMFMTTLQDIVDKTVDDYKDLYQLANDRENRQKNDLQNTNQNADVQSVAVTQQQNEQATQPIPKQKLEAIGYPYSLQKSEDGSFNIPTVNESLYWRYAAGIISMHEAAQEFTKNGWTNFVDEDYTRKQFAEINQKWHKLDDDLQPLAPEQIKNTAKQYAPLEDDPKMSLAEPISGQYSSSPSQKVDGPSAVVQQQIADFKEATGIQLEVKGDRLVYDKTLYLRGKNITELPENLTVGGLLDLGDTPIKKLPEGLSVGGSLWLANTPITELPNNLTVKENLYLHNSNIQQLPENLTVGGSLYLDKTSIKELPNDLTVGRHLDLTKTPIKELPDNLTVGGDLNLTETPIKELPADLKVKEAIYMNDRTIKATPDVMSPDGYIDLVKVSQKAELKEAINLLGNPVHIAVGNSVITISTDKNDNLQVIKDNQDLLSQNNEFVEKDEILSTAKKALSEQLSIVVSETLDKNGFKDCPFQLDYMPKKEHVLNGHEVENDFIVMNLDNNGLHLYRDLENAYKQEILCDVKELSPNQIANIVIYELYKPFKELETNFEDIQKNLQQAITFKESTGIEPEIQNSRADFISALQQLEDKTIKGDLDLSNTQIKILPENLTVEGDLALENTPIERLPENLTVEGSLYLTNTSIQQLPEGLSVGKSLDLTSTPMKELPDGLMVNENLRLGYTQIERLPDNLTVNGNLDLYDTPITELPADLKVKGNIIMSDRTIRVTPDVLTHDDYIDLVKAGAPIQQNAKFSLWDKLSALLMDTNEDKHLKAKEDDILVLETDEDQGLSDLEKMHLIEVWQHPTEGIITFKIEGSNKEFDLSDYPEFVPQIYDYVARGEMEMVNMQKIAEQKDNDLSQQTAQTQNKTPEMEDSLTPKEYTTMWMTSIAEKTPKDRPSDIVFIKDFNLDDTSKPIYTAYGKDADRLAEKISSSVATMRPEIEGKRYPYADVSGSKIEAVRIDLMTNNVHPIIIDVEGNRITNDTKLDYTKEERKAFLDSLKPEAKQREDILQTLQQLGNPERINIPNTSERFGYDQSLIIPQRFGHQEVALTEIKRSKNGSYSAGNDEEGYYPINKMNTNNLSEVQQALQKVVANRPENLVKELVNQINSGKAEVSPDTFKGRYIININDQPGGRNYPRGFKQFTVGADMQDHVLLHDDRGGSKTDIIKVDPKTLQQMVNYAQSKLGLEKNHPTQNAEVSHKFEASVTQRQGQAYMTAKVDDRQLDSKQISKQDWTDFKSQRTSAQQLINKYYSKEEISQSHELKRSGGRGR